MDAESAAADQSKDILQFHALIINKAITHKASAPRIQDGGAHS